MDSWTIADPHEQVVVGDGLHLRRNEKNMFGRCLGKPHQRRPKKEGDKNPELSLGRDSGDKNPFATHCWALTHSLDNTGLEDSNATLMPT